MKCHKGDYYLWKLGVESVLFFLRPFFVLWKKTKIWRAYFKNWLSLNFRRGFVIECFLREDEHAYCVFRRTMHRLPPWPQFLFWLWHQALSAGRPQRRSRLAGSANAATPIFSFSFSPPLSFTSWGQVSYLFNSSDGDSSNIFKRVN